MWYMFLFLALLLLTDRGHDKQKAHSMGQLSDVNETKDSTQYTERSEEISAKRKISFMKHNACVDTSALSWDQFVRRECSQVDLCLYCDS